MCFSLLVVKYEADKGVSPPIKCENEADERARVKDLCDKDMPVKIEVFRCQRTINRKRIWEELPYSPPETNGSTAKQEGNHV